MTHRWATGLTVGLLLLAPAALAQSGQGGYLGLNPGAIPNPQVSRVPESRSGPAPADEMMAWCSNSPEPSRCRARAGVEHEICAGRTPDSYARCRAAMDQMHGP